MTAYKAQFKLTYTEAEIEESTFKPSIKFNASMRNMETKEKQPALFGKNPYNMRLDKTKTKVNPAFRSNISCLQGGPVSKFEKPQRSNKANVTTYNWMKQQAVRTTRNVDKTMSMKRSLNSSFDQGFVADNLLSTKNHRDFSVTNIRERGHGVFARERASSVSSSRGQRPLWCRDQFASSLQLFG